MTGDEAAGDVFRVVVHEVGAGGRSASSYRLRPGDTLPVGRAEPVSLGADDEGVSRSALTVTLGADAWHLHVTNRNGAQLYPWAQAPSWLAAPAGVDLRWPRIGVRVAGGDPVAEHWVLLEADRFTWSISDAAAASDVDTVLSPRPRELTLNQLATVYATFPDHLAWPPVTRPAARSLEAVAARLGVSASAIRERLHPVQERAGELGLVETGGVTDPSYVFHLAANGYLTDIPPPVELP